MDLLKSLNPPQREAATYLGGPLLILAGAGSGKTRALTHRLAYLVGSGTCDPWSILAVTFTNKAANEMKTRVAKLLGRRVEGLWIGTFHSICARILRKDGHRLGYGRDFTIYDEDDRMSLIRRCMNELAIPDRKVPVSAVASRISGAKDQLVGPEEYQTKSYDFFEKNVARVYSLYQQRLLAHQACDFDDLIFKTVQLFREHPAALDEYSRRFKHILVDEYQDTNHAQYMLVKLLSEKHRRLAVVGDDDQSIYGFRGADIRNILEFEHDFPEAKVIKLEQNYRSTQNILDCANTVVANNVGRKGKELWTDNPKGERIGLAEAWDERDEARRVCRALKDRPRGESLRSHVVLYRTNAQSRALEEALRREALPYVIVGGIKFYERREVKDVLAYLKAAVNPADEVSLRRIVNVPGRGIGETTLMRAAGFAKDSGLPLYDALGEPGKIPGLGPGVRQALAAFRSLLDDLRDFSQKHDAEEAAKRAVESTGYLEYLKDQYTDPEERQNRLENVYELVSAADDFCQRSEDKGLPAFLAEVSLIADIDRWNEGAEAVTLMTMHNAKGLEFDHVHIVGLEDGLLPHSASMESQAELEEERRLFYVAVTRARRTLEMLYARSRRRYGGPMPSTPSRFLAEVPAKLVRAEPSERPDGRREEPVSDSTDYGARGRVKGVRVRHPVWGVGTVVDSEGEGDDMKLSIVFSGGVRKKVVATFVEPVR